MIASSAPMSAWKYSRYDVASRVADDTISRNEGRLRRILGLCKVDVFVHI